MSGFDSLDRDAPDLPGHTCPAIDRAISAIRSIGKELSYAARHCEHDDTTSIIEAIERTVDALDLEPLREQNTDLRDAADWWRARAQELCIEIEGLRADLKRCDR